MGLPQLFEVIKDYDKSVIIAQLAEEHHRQNGRPLRVAIDEADWRFNNLTQTQVYAIRDTSDQAFQGIEKSMFYRICRLLTLNIQLIFVFDGPGRPWKHGKRGGGKIDYRERDLLKEMLRHFGIPSHEAPGEAEAECARLQILGLVDAVWSQDSDCLMFGCTLWLRDDRVIKEKGSTDRSKENTAKNKKLARIVDAIDLKSHLQIDREGLVLYAMLVGGDYDEKGLPGCGSSTAMKIVKKGLGMSLCICRNQRDCDGWAQILDEALRSAGGRGLCVPPGFPDFKTLVKYNSPKVSSDETLRNNPKLNAGYTRPIDELKLLEVTSSRFNIWGRLYMNWVGPVLLTRYMTNRSETLPQEVVHGIKLTKRALKKTGDDLQARVFERKLTFSPFELTSLRRKDFEDERNGYWNGDRTTGFDPYHRVESEMPSYWLEKILPNEVLHPPPSGPKPKAAKRKRLPIASDEPPEPPAAKKREWKAPQEDVTGAPNVKVARKKTPKPAQQITPRPKKSATKRRLDKTPVGHIPDIIELSDSEDELKLPIPRVRAKSSVWSAISQVIDFGSPSSAEESFGLDSAPVEGNAHRKTHEDGASGSNDKFSQLAMRSAPSALPLKSLSHGSQAAVVSPLAHKLAKSISDSIAGSPPDSDPHQFRASYATPGRELPVPAKARHPTSTLGETTLPARETSLADDASADLCCVEDVRAARLRHFKNLTKPEYSPTKDTAATPPLLARHGGRRSNYVPDGAECIDLTED